ncbi:hypothetical protein M3668_06495 [Rothia sp. P100]|uniref:hypothetical protein n=1 Tax=Rothia sp. P100 TaxID=2939578 RepID=UPI00203E8370|nr:hypothetical protein [Rothia sp. P100]MCM3510424.1 hypothetical protein [Rothia sp. P100]
MADYGGVTAHSGIPYRGNDSPADIDDDNEAAYKVIDAKLADVDSRLAARENVFIVHEGEGQYSFHNGLGEPLAVQANNDGDWEIIA